MPADRLARAAAPAPPRGDIPVFRGRGGLRPGVDITSSGITLDRDFARF